MATGGPNVKSTEAFSFLSKHPQNCSRDLGPIPVPMTRARGGFLKEGVLNCERIKWGEKDGCFYLPSTSPNKWFQLDQTLSQRRYGAASIVIDNGKTLWITGGKSSQGYLKSTEFVTLKDDSTDLNPSSSFSIQPGPDLPIATAHHLLIKLNSTTAMLIGGDNASSPDWPDYQKDGLNYLHLKSTYFLDIPRVVESTKATVSSVRGPDFQQPSSSLMAGVLNDPADGNRRMVVLVGEIYNKTEFLMLDQLDQGWTPGPDKPKAVGSSAGVTTPDGKSFLVIGGSNNRMTTDPYIYQLQHQNGCWKWSQLEQKLRVPRQNHIALVVPDSFCNVQCQENSSGKVTEDEVNKG